jgi:hypothetical protein
MLLVLSACATRPAPSPEPLSSIKSLAIVSALGDQVTLQEYGSGTKSGWGQILNAYGIGSGAGIQRVPVGDWGVDAFVADSVSNLLGGCYEISSASDEALAAKLREVIGRGVPHVDIHGDDAPPLIEKAVRTGAASVGPDAYLVVVKARESYGRRNEGPLMSGLGLVHSSGLLPGEENNVFALYRIYLVDHHQYRVVASAIAASPGQSWRSPFFGPVRQVDASWWADSFERMTDGQKQQLRQAVHDLIGRSLPNTVARVGLRCSKPPPQPS